MPNSTLVHVITGLKSGGAEWALARTAMGLQQRGYDQHVVSLTADGPVGDALRQAGIPVHILPVPMSLGGIRSIRKLRDLFSALNAQWVQSWMYHADFAVSLASRKPTKQFWGIRNSTLTPGAAKRSTRMIRAICARRSYRFPQQIISCSHAAAQHHIEIGYDRTKMNVIPNGYDLARFSPNEELRNSWRTRLGYSEFDFVFGHAARNHPQKGHEIFLRACDRVRAERIDSKFMLCGEGVAAGNAPFHELASKLTFQFLGQIEEMAGFYAACDGFVLSSVAGEAFPNVVAEAMACGVPCVVTDIGDAKEIVGDTGWVVSPNDERELAGAMLNLANVEDQMSRRTSARQRICDHFQLESVISRFDQVYQGS